MMEYFAVTWKYHEDHDKYFVMKLWFIIWLNVDIIATDLYLWVVNHW